MISEIYIFSLFWFQRLLIVRGGRATAQAVSRRLPTAAARVQTRVWSCGILWWTKVALGLVFSENFGFPCQSTFHVLLHNHLHYHSRLRSANSLTIQNLKKKIVRVPITVASRSRHEMSSLARTLGSWVRTPIKAWMFFVLGRSLATGWSSL
jgi:hypothetical protein